VVGSLDTTGREVMTMKSHSEQSQSPYISPKELTQRWQCARSSVDRITRLAGMKRLYLGHGKNGIVRFLRKEVEAYELDRMI